jgi:hypothetical protein
MRELQYRGHAQRPGHSDEPRLRSQAEKHELSPPLQSQDQEHEQPRTQRPRGNSIFRCRRCKCPVSAMFIGVQGRVAFLETYGRHRLPAYPPRSWLVDASRARLIKILLKSYEDLADLFGLAEIGDGIGNRIPILQPEQRG